MRNLTVILTALLALTIAGGGEDKSETAGEAKAEQSTSSETEPAETAD